MARRIRVPCPVVGLLLAGLSFAPAAQEKKAGDRPSLAELRRDAAQRQFDLTWQYYQQNRVETFDVYLWSRLLLDAQRAVARTPEERMTAVRLHLDHMARLEALIKKIRRLGFGKSNDVGASEYFRIEAECWLDEAKGG